MTTSGDTGRVRARRSDAESNRLKVMAAAAEVFSELGTRATMPDVAERAGVGNATVYRSFGSKRELVIEMAVLRLRSMEQQLRAAYESSTPAAAFPDLVVDLLVQLRDDRLVSDLLHLTLRNPDLNAARERVDVLMQAMLDVAIADGQVAPDVTWRELSVLILGISARLAELEIAEPERWKRMGAMILNAIRP